MHDAQEIPTSEIAAELGITEGTVRKRLRRAREAFKASMKRYQARAQHRVRGGVGGPLFGPLPLPKAKIPLPDEVRERVWARIQEAQLGGGDSGGGGGPRAVQAVPVAKAAPALSGTTAAAVAGVIAAGALFVAGIAVG